MDRKQVSFLIMSFLIAICYFYFAQKENDDLDLPPSLEDKPSFPLGSKDNPIRYLGPQGERNYLPFAQKENNDLDLPPSLEDKPSFPLGSKDNPIRCLGPQGERDYLSRLRCPDGSSPEFERYGSYGEGPYGTMMDGFRVYCPNDAKKSRPTVFMEMYHEHVEEQPIEGFTIRPKLWEKYMEAAVDAVKQENYPEAKKHVKAAVLEIEKHGSDNDIQSATTFFADGHISLHIKNFDMAKVAFRKAIKFEKSSRGENHPRVAISLIMLAHAHLELKEIKKVEPLIQETIKIYKITSDTNNRKLILRQLMPYIMLLDEKGHIDIAKRLISQLKDLIE